MRFYRPLIPMLAVAMASVSRGAAAQPPTAADAQAQAAAARQNAITDRYLTAVQVAMAGKVDTKNAAVGQEVSAKTVSEVRLADDTVLPKGTRLVGHIVQLRAGGAEQGSAVLTLVFDRAEVKPGKSLAVRCVIRAVASNAPGTMAAERGVLPPATPDGVPSRLGRTPGGGGVAVGSDTGLPLPPIGEQGSGVGRAGPLGAPPIAGPVPGIGGRTASPVVVDGTPGGVTNRKVVDAGESLSGAPRATGLQGVMLWAAPTASGTLTSTGKPIVLDVGMQMTLGVIAR